jgi:hypothetical protein
MLEEVDFFSVGAAIQPRRADFAIEAPAATAESRLKASPTEKKATAQVCGWQVQRFTVQSSRLKKRQVAGLRVPMHFLLP